VSGTLLTTGYAVSREVLLERNTRKSLTIREVLERETRLEFTL
jgi:hypothetical protein